MQKASWMRTKIFSTSMMNRMHLGSRAAFKAADRGSAKAKDAVEKAAADAVVAGDSSNHVARRKALSGRSQPRRLVLAN